jgi:[NiFe] hydrogenase diaphorase moiety large subunit
MLLTEQEKLRKQIEGWVEKFGGDRRALMPILQEIQRAHHYVSDYAMQVVADLLEIHPVEVFGVVSFYSFLSDKPQGQFIIRLCRTITCDMAGKDRVARQLENDLGILFGQTTADGMFTLEWANCLGMCDQGPALLVNDRVYTDVTPDKVNGILDDCRRRQSVYAIASKEEHLA